MKQTIHRLRENVENYVSDKRLTSRIYKSFYNSLTKEQMTQIKICEKDLNRPYK